MTIKAAFLDRDGVLNHDSGYIHKIEDFRFIDGVIDALKYLQNMGYVLIVVTNQSGIGRGYFTEEDYQVLTHFYRQHLSAAGIELLDIHHCPHLPTDKCDCRIPEPGMLLDAIKKYDIDVESSIMFGDKSSDMQAAATAGIPRGFFITEKNEPNIIHPAITVMTMPSLWHCVFQDYIE